MARSITRNGSTYLLCGCNTTDQCEAGGDVLATCYACHDCGTAAHTVDEDFTHRDCSPGSREYLHERMWLSAPEYLLKFTRA